MTTTTSKLTSVDFNATLNLIKDGNQQIILDHHENVILVLGNTGSGKSTLTHLLAGDNDKLISVEVGEDTGEYIIEDLNDKISANSTIISKTTIPEQVVDQKTDTAFYDCPGFSDTRNSSMDIANTYFIRKVLDHAKSVKLIFAVNHNSLKVGMDRIDFLTLTKHATNLIKNIDKFKDSIALVATKVDNSYKINAGIPTLVPDSKLLSNIENFLVSTRKDVELNSMKKPNDQDQKIIKIIDILLSKVDDKLSKIALFRRPDRPGKLSEIELMQDGKTIINKMIYDSIEFGRKTSEDFGYTISEETKSYINNLIESINLEITLNVKKISNEIIRYYQKDEKLTSDIYDLKDKFDLANANITKIIKEINPDTQPTKLISDLLNLAIPISENFLKNITLNEEYYDVVQKVTEKNLKYQTNDWKNEIMETKNIINNSKAVYNFLIILFVDLSEYSVQSKLKNYSIGDLKKRISSGLNNSEPLGTIIKPFLDNVYSIGKWPDNIKDAFESMGNIIIDDGKVQLLNEMIDSTLNSTITVKFFYDILQIHGDLVRISDLNREITKIHQNIYSYSLQRIRIVEILASNKIYIDEDFDKLKYNDRSGNSKFSEELKLVFIAPVWEIIGNRKIILDGKKITYNEGGPNYTEFYFIPAGRGGAFVGFGEKFIDIQNLLITSNGGPGDKGRRGCSDFLIDGSPGGFQGEIIMFQVKSIEESKKLYIQYQNNHGLDGMDCDNSKYRLRCWMDMLFMETFIFQSNNIGYLDAYNRFKEYLETNRQNCFINKKVSNFKNKLIDSSNYDRIEKKNRIGRSIPKYHQYNYQSMSSNNYSLVTDRINFMNNYPELNYENRTLPKNNIVDFSNHNFNSTLALMDLITKKIFGNHAKFRSSIDELSRSDILVYSLNIVEEYEKLLTLFSKNMKVLVDIDGPLLVSKLQKLFSNGKFSEIEKVLFDSVKINNKPISRETKFGMKLQQMIAKLL